MLCTAYVSSYRLTGCALCIGTVRWFLFGQTRENWDLSSEYKGFNDAF